MVPWWWLLIVGVGVFFVMCLLNGVGSASQDARWIGRVADMRQEWLDETTNIVEPLRGALRLAHWHIAAHSGDENRGVILDKIEEVLDA